MFTVCVLPTKNEQIQNKMKTEQLFNEHKIWHWIVHLIDVNKHIKGEFHKKLITSIILYQKSTKVTYTETLI